MNLQEFIEKAKIKESKKIKAIELEIEGFGKIEFQRPSDNVLIEYTSAATSAVIVDEKNKVIGQNLKELGKAANELVYLCCSLLRTKEIQKEFEVGDPFDTPSKIFGFMETMKISGELIEIFQGLEVRKEVEEEIKN